MSEPVLPPLSFAGREFSAADLELIRQIASDIPSLGITEIARTACELLEWKRPSGGLKNLECRRLIEHLAGQGLLRLPGRRGRGAPGPQRTRAAADAAHRTGRTTSGDSRIGRCVCALAAGGGARGAGRSQRESRAVQRVA